MVTFDRLPKSLDALPASRLREQDGPCPPIFRRLERQHGFDVMDDPLGSRYIFLVHDKDIGDLQDSCFECLHRVARFRAKHNHHRVHNVDDIDLALPCANGFDIPVSMSIIPIRSPPPTGNSSPAAWPMPFESPSRYPN